MDDRDVAELWNGNAEAWTKLSRAGYDVYRDGLNTPAFLELLPDVRGLRGLDIGCGEGHNTRLLADRGARMSAVDISSVFISHALATEQQDPRGITYHVASASALPFDVASFDFVVGFMSFMDAPHLERVLAEAHRVLRPGGFLQFSIEHPCFATPHRRHVRTPDGRTIAFEIGRYFERLDGEMSEWIFSSAPPEAKADFAPFRIPRFSRPLSEWINLLVDAGFVVERLGEPRASDELLREYPMLQDTQVLAYFLHVRSRKTGGHGQASAHEDR